MKVYLCRAKKKDMSEKRTELQELGEFGLIKKLTNDVDTHHSETLKGIGDDAAVIVAGNGAIVVTTDMLTEGVHFDMGYTPLMHLGYKAVVVNLSDVCAMNALPTQITVSLAVSNRFSLEAIEELYSGIKKACEVYQVDLIGGDTTSSQSGLTISITALGYTDEKTIAYRDGAKENDLLVVTGDVGGAYMGLQVLEREKYVFKDSPQIQPDLTGHDYILERQLKPEARVDVVKMLKSMDVQPSSMIDISDGLASEIFHICEQSKLGVKLYEDKIPIDPSTYNTARDFELDPTVCAISGGEDYELLFTISQDDYEKVKGNPNMTVIGHMTDLASGHTLITKNGLEAPLKAQGWDTMNEGRMNN